MKKIHYITVIVFLLSVASFAQPGSRMKERFSQKKEQVKSLKVAFITNELSLTPDESAKFWPLYNAYEDKQHEIRKTKFKKTDNDALDQLSEKEASSILTQLENTDEELYLTKKKFITSLKGVLPSVKILKLKKAEEDFSRKLLQQYRNKKAGK
jgi:hypothetical protein